MLFVIGIWPPRRLTSRHLWKFYAAQKKLQGQALTSIVKYRLVIYHVILWSPRHWQRAPLSRSAPPPKPATMDRGT